MDNNDNLRNVPGVSLNVLFSFIADRIGKHQLLMQLMPSSQNKRAKGVFDAEYKIDGFEDLRLQS